MPERFLTYGLGVAEVFSTVRKTDMTGMLQRLVQQLNVRDQALTLSQLRATLIGTVGCQAGSLILYANQFGNIEARFPALANPADWLYSTPGCVILFAVREHSFSVTRYVINEEGLERGITSTVDAANPCLIDGRREVYSLDTQQRDTSCVLAINFPDAARDIFIYCKKTLQKLAWLPENQDVQSYLISLDAMSVSGDPGVTVVAQQLIYHPHPEVKWAAYTVLLDKDPTAAVQSEPVLRSFNSALVNGWLDERTPRVAV